MQGFVGLANPLKPVVFPLIRDHTFAWFGGTTVALTWQLRLTQLRNRQQLLRGDDFTMSQWQLHPVGFAIDGSPPFVSP